MAAGTAAGWHRRPRACCSPRSARRGGPPPGAPVPGLQGHRRSLPALPGRPAGPARCCCLSAAAARSAPLPSCRLFRDLPRKRLGCYGERCLQGTRRFPRQSERLRRTAPASGTPRDPPPPPPSFLVPPPRVPVSPSSGPGALAAAGVGPGEPHGQSRGAHAWAEWDTGCCGSRAGSALATGSARRSPSCLCWGSMDASGDGRDVAVKGEKRL